MSSDNYRAYVAIPMNMLHTSSESDADGAAPSRCRSRNYLLPKCLAVAAVCILLLTLWITHCHHHSLEEFGWNEIAHDKITYGEDVVVWHDEKENGEIDEKWLVDKNGLLIHHEKEDETVVFDASQDEFMEEEEDVEVEVWNAEEEEEEADLNEEEEKDEEFEAVDEPLEFFGISEQEKTVNVVDNIVEIPGLP